MDFHHQLPGRCQLLPHWGITVAVLLESRFLCKRAAILLGIAVTLVSGRLTYSTDALSLLEEGSKWRTRNIEFSISSFPASVLTLAWRLKMPTALVLSVEECPAARMQWIQWKWDRLCHSGNPTPNQHHVAFQLTDELHLHKCQLLLSYHVHRFDFA